MLEILIGALSGCLVCLFGIWAFIKGQQTMLQIKSGGSPENILVKPIFKEQKTEDSGPPLSEQIRAVFAEPYKTKGGDGV